MTIQYKSSHYPPLPSNHLINLDFVSCQSHNTAQTNTHVIGLLLLPLGQLSCFLCSAKKKRNTVSQISFYTIFSQPDHTERKFIHIIYQNVRHQDKSCLPWGKAWFPRLVSCTCSPSENIKNDIRPIRERSQTYTNGSSNVMEGNLPLNVQRPCKGHEEFLAQDTKNQQFSNC